MKIKVTLYPAKKEFKGGSRFSSVCSLRIFLSSNPSGNYFDLHGVRLVKKSLEGNDYIIYYPDGIHRGDLFEVFAPGSQLDKEIKKAVLKKLV